jgi:membrane-associated phospholipid phosphatase
MSAPGVTGRPTPAPAARPESGAHAATGAAVLLVAGGVFLAIASQVVPGAPLAMLAVRVANWLHAQGTPALTRFFLDVSLVHDVAAVAVYTFALAGILAMQRDWYWARRVVIVVVSGFLFNFALKLAYERTRPVFEQPIVSLTSYSFPSGHTALTTLFYGIFALVLISRLEHWAARLCCLAAFVGMVVLVGFSRIYLGAHYLSDVAAAACAAVAWTAFVLLALPKFGPRPPVFPTHP